MNQVYDVVIVGSGHAGANAALALRQQKVGGTVAMIGAEPELPYERPCLSKDYLTGKKTFERMLIRPATFWRDQQIDLHPGQNVTAVDPVANRLKCDGGETFAYQKLIWAAGGSPRRLSVPGHDLHGIHVIRTRADVDRIAAQLPECRSVVLIGGGYIGLEAAASLRGLGKSVTVIEAADRVLARVAAPPLSDFFEKAHRRRGVDLRLGANIARLEGLDGRVRSVHFADGSAVPADLVIVGIGVTPAIGPLLTAGAKESNGVEIDAFCQTSLSDIHAIGDCAAHVNAYAEGRVRVESVQNANDQAQTVARTIAGRPAPYDAVPWFWSDQYDIRLQIAGLAQDFDRIVVRGDIGATSFSLVYLKAGQIKAINCINSPRDFMQGKRLVAARARLNAERIADPALSLLDQASSAEGL